MSSATKSQYLYLTTRGRKTGQPREIEIWFTTHKGRYYIIAEYTTSKWVQNLQADGNVQVRVSGSKFPALARVLSEERDGEIVQAVRELSRQKYGWGDGLVVELIPQSE